MMEVTLIWLIGIWDKFCIWVTNQPTFVEVAFGVGLFYLTLQIVKAVFKLIAFLLSGVFSVPLRSKKQKDMRSKPRRKKTSPRGDDTPPFVFR